MFFLLFLAKPKRYTLAYYGKVPCRHPGEGRDPVQIRCA